MKRQKLDIIMHRIHHRRGIWRARRTYKRQEREVRYRTAQLRLPMATMSTSQVWDRLRASSPAFMRNSKPSGASSLQTGTYPPASDRISGHTKLSSDKIQRMDPDEIKRVQQRQQV